MKKAFAFLMCVMIAFFFTITTAQSKSVVGSDMGIPVVQNLELNYFVQTAENLPIKAMLQNWGLLYRQVVIYNLCNITTEKQQISCLRVNICHYDPGLQNYSITSKNRYKIH